MLLDTVNTHLSHLCMLTNESSLAPFDYTILVRILNFLSVQKEKSVFAVTRESLFVALQGFLFPFARGSPYIRTACNPGQIGAWSL